MSAKASIGTGGAQSVRRAMEIVRTVAQIQRSGASLSRVAGATGLSIPTTYRLLRTMTDERLLRFSKEDRCYHIGPLAFELGLAALPEAGVDARLQRIVSEVARRTRLTSYLMARSGDEVVCLSCALGTATIRAMPMEVGQRVPLGIGAGGLAILASLDDEQIARILAAQAERYRVFPGGAQDRGAILQRIGDTRRRGYSISTGTVAAGVTGIGVPAGSDHGSARHAVTVSAVADAFEAREAAALADVIRRALQG